MSFALAYRMNQIAELESIEAWKHFWQSTCIEWELIELWFEKVLAWMVISIANIISDVSSTNLLNIEWTRTSIFEHPTNSNVFIFK